MQEVNIKTLAHNLKKYMDIVNNGETIVITKRNKPIADLVPHDKKIITQGWKRKVLSLPVKGIDKEYITKIIRESRS